MNKNTIKKVPAALAYITGFALLGAIAVIAIPVALFALPYAAWILSLAAAALTPAGVALLLATITGTAFYLKQKSAAIQAGV